MPQPIIPEDILELSHARATSFCRVFEEETPVRKEVGQIWSTFSALALSDGRSFQTDDPRLVVILDAQGEWSDLGEPLVTAPISLRVEMASEWDLLISQDLSPLGFSFIAEVWNQTPVVPVHLRNFIGRLPKEAEAALQYLYVALLEDEEVPSSLEKWVGVPLLGEEDPRLSFQRAEIAAVAYLATTATAALELELAREVEGGTLPKVERQPLVFDAMAEGVEDEAPIETENTDPLLPLLLLPTEAQVLFHDWVGAEDHFGFLHENLERFNEGVLTAFGVLMSRVGVPLAEILWTLLDTVWNLRVQRELESLPPDRQQMLQDIAELHSRDDMATAHYLLEVCHKLLDYLDHTNTPNLVNTIQAAQGDLYQALYRHTINSDVAERAERAYKRALEVCTQKVAPIRWAHIQIDLGNLLLIRYELTGEELYAEDAVRAYHGALEVCTRDAAPSDWARTYNNLSNLLLIRYQHTGEDIYAEEAAGAFREMLEVQTQEADPLGWAQVQASLGNLLLIRYERTEEDIYAEEAAGAFQKALKVYTREDAPSYWALTMNNLGALLQKQYERTKKDLYAEAAIRAYKGALEVRTREATPSNWAQTYNNLGNLLSTRYERTKKDLYAEDAIRAFRGAQEVYTRQAAPSFWAMCEHNLGNLFSRRYERTREERYAEEAARAYRGALEIFDPLVEPAYALLAQRNLAHMLTHQKQWAHADAIYADAVQTAERQYLSAPSDAERRRLMAKHVLLYQEHAYCLLRMGEPLRALARLDEGRARGLGEILGLEGAARAMHGEEGVARLRVLRQVLRSAEALLDEAEAQLRTSAPGLARNKAADDRTTAAAGVRTAYDVLRAEVRALGLEPPVLAPDSLVGLLPSNIAVIALLSGPDAHVLVLYQGAVLPIALPDFRKEDISRLVNAMPPQIERWIDAYDARRQAVRTLRAIKEAGLNSATAESALDEANQKWREALDEMADTYGNYEAGWYMGYRLAFEIVKGEGHPSAELAVMQAWKGIVARTVDAVRERFWHPIRNVLPENIEEVLLLTGGESALLPFHAAANELTVGYAPSLGVWSRCQEEAVGREANSLLLATPAPADDLIFTSAEAEWLMQLFAGLGHTEHNGLGLFPGSLRLDQEEATVEGVMRASVGRSVVHFSGHATYNWDEPLSSGLLCRDGVLTLARARQEMDLRATRLVGLSACSTGISDVFGSGEEWIGLPAGLLEAGASAVIASLWPVNDLSTAFLMDRFYTLWLDRKVDRTISAALREAAEWLRSASWADLGERVTASQLSDELRNLLNDLLKKMQLVSTTKLPDSVGGDFIIEMARANPDEKPFAAPYYWAAFAAYGAVF
jgi:1,2-phenylacetyl-CoA epoxidase PaaB subunit